MFSFSRRRFLELAGALSLAPALDAIEPFTRTGAPRLRLSLAAYSFRDFFSAGKDPGKIPPERRLDLPGFIDLCARHGCEGAELTSYYFPKDVTADVLRVIRRHAFLRGISISGTAVGNNFALPKGPQLDEQIADVKRWIDRAALLGAPHIRVFAGGAAAGLPLADAKRNCIAALEECCAYAGAHGIFLGLENHGGIVAEPEGMLEIVRAVKSPWFGVNLDTGNFHTADPYAALAQCAPYAVNVQIKSEMRRAGAKVAERADYARIVALLRAANYQGWVALEYEAADPWNHVPKELDALRTLLGGPVSSVGGEAWQPLFDGKSLAGWKVTDFAGHGAVSVANGQLFLDSGDPLTGITYAQAPPLRMNYELRLEAMKLAGDDFFCGLTFPVAKASCTLIMGGWGGTLVGISSINGQDASENATTQFRKFDPNRWYRVRVRVTPEKLAVWIDDEQFVDLEIAEQTLGMRAGEIELSQPLGLATFQTKAAFRDFKIRPL